MVKIHTFTFKITKTGLVKEIITFTYRKLWKLSGKHFAHETGVRNFQCTYQLVQCQYVIVSVQCRFNFSRDLQHVYGFFFGT